MPWVASRLRSRFQRYCRYAARHENKRPTLALGLTEQHQVGSEWFNAGCPGSLGCQTAGSDSEAWKRPRAWVALLLCSGLSGLYATWLGYGSARPHASRLSSRFSAVGMASPPTSIGTLPIGDFGANRRRLAMGMPIAVSTHALLLYRAMPISQSNAP